MNRHERSVIICAIIFVTWPIFVIGHTTYGDYVEKEERFATGDHITMLQASKTPEDVKRHALLAIDGIQAAGLQPHDQSRLLPWNQAPTTSIAWELDQLQQIVNLADEIIEREDAYTTNNWAQFDDFYNERMNIIQNRAANLGDITHGAYVLNNHLALRTNTLWFWTPFAIVAAVYYGRTAFLLGDDEGDLWGEAPSDEFYEFMHGLIWVLFIATILATIVFNIFFIHTG